SASRVGRLVRRFAVGCDAEIGTETRFTQGPSRYRRYRFHPEEANGELNEEIIFIRRIDCNLFAPASSAGSVRPRTSPVQATVRILPRRETRRWSGSNAGGAGLHGGMGKPSARGPLEQNQEHNAAG